MGLETWLALISTAASLAGLAWRRERVKALALAFLALLSAILAVRGIMNHRAAARIQAQIVRELEETTVMSADQLYEEISAGRISRSAFDAALNHAIESRAIEHRMLQIRTPDNEAIRLRVYSKSDTMSPPLEDPSTVP